MCIHSLLNLHLGLKLIKKMKKSDIKTIKSFYQIGFASVIIGVTLATIIDPNRTFQIPVPAFEIGAGTSIIIRMFGYIWLVFDENEFIKIIKAKDLKD